MLRDKVIGNSLHVLDILRNISKTQELEATVIFSADDIFRGTLYYYRKDKQLYLKLPDMDKRFIPDFEVHVSFLLRETVFNFDSTIIDITEDVINLDPPIVFTSSFKRHYSRYSPTGEEELVIKMPDGSLHDVKDITTSGVAFYSEKLNYKIGDRIRNIEILLTDDIVRLDADIKYIVEADNGNFFYGTAFANNDWFSHYSLFQYIFKQIYPNIKQVFEYSKEDLYLLYEKSGYFALKKRDEVEESFNNMYKNLRIAEDYPQVTTNPVFVHNDKMYMSASVLRIYNRTFLAQHLAAIPESRLYPSSKHSIYLGLSDYLICNPYYDYYLTYWYSDNKWNNRMYRSIAGYIDDSDKYLCDTIDFLHIYYNRYSSTEGNSYKAQTMNDFTEFSAYATENLPKLITSTYAYSENDVSLTEIKQVYELIGLYVERNILKITKDGELAAYAVCEAYTPGLNLYNLLDSIKVYIVDKKPDINSILRAIMDESVFFFDRYDKNNAYMFIKLDEGVKDNIDVPGIEYASLLGRGIVDRSGIIEYKNLLLNMSR